MICRRGGGAIRPFDFEDGMNFPGNRAPRIMKPVWCDRLDGRSDIGRSIVFIVPQEIASDPNFLGLVPGRLIGHIGLPKKCGQLLDPDTIPVDRVLCPRCDFTDDRRRIAVNSRRVVV